MTQLSHRLLEHLGVRGALQTLLLLVVVWSAWVGTSWITNWFDPARLPVRLMLVAVMLASLFMSVAIPDAFGERGLMFALAYVAIQVGRDICAHSPDTAGRRPLSQLRRALTPQGALVIVGGEGGDRWLGGFQRQIFAPLRSLFTDQKLTGLMFDERQQDLLTLRDLIEAGKLKPVIDRTYPLSEAREAIRYLGQGHARGKVVLTVSD